MFNFSQLIKVKNARSTVVQKTPVLRLQVGSPNCFRSTLGSRTWFQMYVVFKPEDAFSVLNLVLKVPTTSQIIARARSRPRHSIHLRLHKYSYISSLARLSMPKSRRNLQTRCLHTHLRSRRHECAPLK
jgi:hypothetical protein